jgi:hypothetical protein
MDMVLSKGSINSIVKKYTLNANNTVTLDIFRPNGVLIMSGLYHSKYKKFTPNQSPVPNTSLFSPNNQLSQQASVGQSLNLLSERFLSLQVNKLMGNSGGGGSTDNPEDECPPGTICLDDVTISAPAPSPDEDPGVDIPDLPPAGPIDYFPTDPTIPTGTETGSEPPAVNKDIIDSLRGYPCAQDLLRKLPNLRTQIAILIKNTFAVNDNINITFKVNSSLAGTTVDGRTIPPTAFVPGITDEETVELNPDILKNASKEYILVTLYHEALHAYFNKMKNQLSPTEFTNRFGNISVNGGRTLFTEVDGHFEMAASNYLNGLRDVIRTFNPNYDIGRAYILAQAGIVQLSPSNKTINEQERDTTKPGFTGTKCP